MIDFKGVVGKDTVKLLFRINKNKVIIERILDRNCKKILFKTIAFG
jgi:hypothetical protein